MNYFLMLIIMGLCVGGYYEFDRLHKKSAAAQLQLTELGTQLDTIKEQDARLQADNARLTLAATLAESTIASLTRQVQDTRAVPVANQQKSFPTPPVGKPSYPISTPGTNDLGTIKTLDGKTFPSCQLLKIQAISIVISYSGGITQIPYRLMPPELQKRFGFNGKSTVALSPDQIELQEQKRKAAGQTAAR